MSRALRWVVKGSTAAVVEIVVVPVVSITPTGPISKRRDITRLVAVRATVAGLDAISGRSIDRPAIISGRAIDILLRVS